MAIDSSLSAPELRRPATWLPFARLTPALRARRRAAADGPDEGRRVMSEELLRSRRYERPFALARLSCRDERPVAGAVRSMVRAVDRVWCERGAVYVLLPETGAEAAARLVERLDKALARLGESNAARCVAVFPRDGLTSDALRSALAGAPAGLPALDAELVREAAAVAEGVALPLGRSGT